MAELMHQEKLAPPRPTNKGQGMAWDYNRRAEQQAHETSVRKMHGVDQPLPDMHAVGIGARLGVGADGTSKTNPLTAYAAQEKALLKNNRQ